MIFVKKQEQFVLERSAGLSLDPGRGDELTGMTWMTEKEKEEEEKFLGTARSRVDQPKVVQEVLADLKSKNNPFRLYCRDSLILS